MLSAPFVSVTKAILIRKGQGEREGTTDCTAKRDEEGEGTRRSIRGEGNEMKECCFEKKKMISQEEENAGSLLRWSLEKVGRKNVFGTPPQRKHKGKCQEGTFSKSAGAARKAAFFGRTR